MSMTKEQIAMYFGGVDQAEARTASAYEEPGVYWDIVRATAFKLDRKKAPMVVVEKTVCRVLEQQPGGNRAGQQIAKVFKSGDYFLSEIKAFLMEVGGMAAGAITPETTSQVIAENTLKGVVYERKSTRKPQKTEGKFFTDSKFIRVVPMSEVADALGGEVTKYFTKEEVTALLMVEQNGQ